MLLDMVENNMILQLYVAKNVPLLSNTGLTLRIVRQTVVWTNGTVEMQIEITDNSDLVKEELQTAVLRALESCGLTAEGYAKLLCPVDTGNLRNSITHQVQDGEEAVYIGSNSEYAAYVELGTGKYYPGGRQTPWVYQDEKGNWHITNGQRAQPYLKPAVADHPQEYKGIIEGELKG